jgi:O-antigen ligase
MREGGSRTATYVLVALVLVAPWPYGATHPEVVRGIAAIALGTSFAILVTLFARGERIHPALPLWPFLGLLALGALQLVPLPEGLSRALAPGPATIWHPSEPAAADVLGRGPHPVSVFPEATRRTLAFGAGLVTLALLAGPALRQRRLAVGATVVVGGGALLVAAYGIVARTLFADKLFGMVAVPTVAPFGPFVSKNHFAGYVEMAALLAAGLGLGLIDDARRGGGAFDWSRSPRAPHAIAAIAAAAAMTLAILISQSRGGALSLGLGVLALGVLRPLARRHGARAGAAIGAGAVIVLAAGVVAILPPESRDRLASIAGVGHEGAGGQARLVVWGDTLRLAATSPAIGHGFGAYADALPPVRTGLGFVRVAHAESDVLETLAETGGVGIALFAAAAVLAVRRVAPGLRHQRDRLRRGLGLGASMACLTLLVHGLVDFNLRIPSNALLFLFCAVLALACASPDEDADHPTGRVPAWAAPGLVALLLTLPLTTPAATGGALPEAARPTALGGRPLTPLRARQAEDALFAALRQRPANAEAWLVLAWLEQVAGARSQAVALATHAAELDPQRTGLPELAQRIVEER